LGLVLEATAARDVIVCRLPMEDTEGQKELTTEQVEMHTATNNVIRIIILRYLPMDLIRNKLLLLWIQWSL
jgi:hypothetical protein